jgi:alpha-L-fucosidase
LGKVKELFAGYYNRVPEGVINNRFSQKFSDFTTPEYAKYDKITPKKWESCRGLGFSFGYNRAEGPEHVLSGDKLIELFVDIVSKNGNLLLNIGPRHDGTISELQVSRLKALGEWLRVNGEGIFESRPWTRPSTKTDDGADLRFTRKKDSLYVFILAKPKGDTLVIPDARVVDTAHVSQLGGRSDLKWVQKDGALQVSVPTSEAGNASVLKITPAPVSAA